MTDLERDPVTTSGPAQSADSANTVGTEAPADVQTSGQPVEAEQQAAQTKDDDAPFDPSTLDPQLQKAYKQMQADYTRKTQALAKDRQKVEAYDAFMANPQASIRQMATQYGLTLQEARQVQAAQQATDQNKDFEPQSWDDVAGWIKQQALADVQQQMAPVIDEVRNWKRSQIESKLDAKFPEWRQYEDKMSLVLQSHPSLVQDPEMLLRVTIPEDVIEARAAKAALAKLASKADSAQVSGGSTTNKQRPTLPSGPVSFQDAVEFAKRQLAEKGIRQH